MRILLDYFVLGIVLVNAVMFLALAVAQKPSLLREELLCIGVDPDSAGGRLGHLFDAGVRLWILYTLYVAWRVTQ